LGFSVDIGRLCSPAAVAPIMDVATKLSTADFENASELFMISYKAMTSLACKYIKKLGNRYVSETDSTYQEKDIKLTFSKDGKELLICWKSKLQNDREERARALEFWKAWWQANMPAIQATWDSGQHRKAKDMVGKSFSDIVALLGEPDYETSEDMGSHRYDPWPTLLGEDDSYRRARWDNVGGRDFHVFLVKPTVYRRVTGNDPGNEKLYAIEAVECNLNSNAPVAEDAAE